MGDGRQRWHVHRQCGARYARVGTAHADRRHLLGAPAWQQEQLDIFQGGRGHAEPEYVLSLYYTSTSSCTVLLYIKAVVRSSVGLYTRVTRAPRAPVERAGGAAGGAEPEGGGAAGGAPALCAHRVVVWPKGRQTSGEGCVTRARTNGANGNGGGGAGGGERERTEAGVLDAATLAPRSWSAAGPRSAAGLTVLPRLRQSTPSTQRAHRAPMPRPISDRHPCRRG